MAARAAGSLGAARGAQAGHRLLLAHAVFAAAYAGFQLLVQIVVYRAFPLVPAAAFPAYVRAHQQRIGYVVGPLFLGLLGTSTALVVRRPRGVRPAGAAGAAGSLLGVLALTGLGAVPQHRRLAGGWDRAAYRRLLAVDAARTALALGNAALAVTLADAGRAASSRS